MKKYLLIPALVFFSYALFAQTADTSKTAIKYPPAEFFYEKDFSSNTSLYNSIDTSLDGVQRYFPGNFPYSLGLSKRKLFFEPTLKIGFNPGLENLDLFGYNKNDLKYYRARTPYTEVFALFGMRKEQMARLLHTQNITKQWNIALSMLRLRSEGFYLRQNCTDNNISLSSNYTSKNNRYSFLIAGIVSSIKTDENGGIRNDDDLDSLLLGNKKLIPVNLLDARTKRRYREVYVKQSLHFGRKENQVKGDSIVSSRIYPTSSFSYSFNANDHVFVYSETSPDSGGYYENIYFDSTQTLDSTHVTTFQNSVSWKSTFLQKITAEVSFSNKVSHLVQYKADSMLATDTLIKDNSIHLEIGKKVRDKHPKGFYWNIGGKYIVSGSNKSDYINKCNFSFLFKNNKKISLDISSSYHAAPFLYSSYASNHFWWRNSFNKVSETQARLVYFDSKNKYSLGGEVNQINNYVYFDSTFLPRQFDSVLTIYSAFVQKNLHLKHFNFNNKITWQQSSSEVVHLPQFITNHSVYYEGKWFKKVMDVQFGFDISFHTSYYADAYMPALGQYYLQQRKKIGNYPFIDFFFNMKISHARVFFKSEHVNSGLMGANYYLVPHVPAPDRSFKVGIKWMFFD